MEPASIVGLVASCVGLAARAVASAKELDDFVASYRDADKAVKKLANQLRLFAVSVGQLEQVLDDRATVSDDLRDTIRSSMQDCGDIIGDLEQHVQKVVSSSDGSKGLALKGKLRLLWSQSAVGKEEETLHRQLQTVMLLIGLVRQNDPRKQDLGLRAPSSMRTLAKSARDARSIRESRDTKSISTSISSSSRWSSSSNTEAEFDMDEELFRSGPYVENYRSMVLRTLKGDNAVPSKNSPQGTVSPPEIPQAKNGRTGLKAVTDPVSRQARDARLDMAPTDSHSQPLSPSSDLPPLETNLRTLLKRLTIKREPMPKSEPKPAHQYEIAPQWPRPNLKNPALLRLLGGSYPVLELIQPRKKETRIVFVGETRSEGYLSHEPEHSEGLNDLCQACQEGNYEWAKYLLKKTDPMVISWAGRNPRMKSPLHLAVETGREDIVELLLGENANPDALDADGLTPFTYAVERAINERASLNITQKLVEHGACLTPNVRPAPVLAAISAGYSPLTELLLENGAECDDRDEEKALDMAVEADRADLVKLVVEHGLYRNNLHLDRALSTNIKMGGSSEISKLLFDSHAGTKDQLYNQDGLTPLNVAVKRVLEADEDLSLVEMLVARYPPEAPNGCPLIFLAVAAGHIDLARLFISKGVDCDAEWKGQLPLDLAVTNDDLDMASTLVRQGNACVDFKPGSAMSPLLTALSLQNHEMALALLATKRKPHDTSHWSSPQTPLGAACCRSMVTVGRRLMEWGAPHEGVSTEPLNRKLHGPLQNQIWPEFGDLVISHYTPLHVAARTSPELTEYLINANADGSATASYKESSTIDGAHEDVITGVTPLHLAVGSAADMLIAQGHASVFDKDSRGRTPLFWAATLLVPGRGRENMAAIEHNLRRGSPVNLRDHNGYTPLAAVFSTIQSCARSAYRLVEGAGMNGSSLNMISTSYMFQDTVRHYIDVSLRLISAGANVEAAMNHPYFITPPQPFGSFGWPLYLRESLGPGYSVLQGETIMHFRLRRHANQLKDHTSS